MDDDVHETIKDIKSKFRLFMNGPIAQSMREKGLGYKLNFGIEYPRIKEIAAGYPRNHAVAQALWKENIRECKILAGLLQPEETFYPEIAEIWIESMDYPELAEYTVMNLFQRLEYAPRIVFEWMASDREYFQLCGFLLMARLLMKGQILNERAANEFTDQALAALQGDAATVRRAASVALRRFVSQSSVNHRAVKKQVEQLPLSRVPELRALAEELEDEDSSH